MNKVREKRTYMKMNECIIREKTEQSKNIISTSFDIYINT